MPVPKLEPDHIVFASRRVPATHFSTGHAISRGAPRRIPRKPAPSLYSDTTSLADIAEALSQLEREEEDRRCRASRYIPQVDDTPALVLSSNSLWSSTCDQERRASIEASARRSSIFGDLTTTTSCIPSPPTPSSLFKRSHSRRSSTQSFHCASSGSVGRASPSPAMSARSRFSSFNFPPIEMPSMPTLFPSEEEGPYAFVAQPTPKAELASNPLETSTSTYLSSSSSASSSSSSSSRLSNLTVSTPPTSAPSSPQLSIISMKRSLSNTGNALYTRAANALRRSGSVSSPSSPVIGDTSGKVVESIRDEEVELVICMPRAVVA